MSRTTSTGSLFSGSLDSSDSFVDEKFDEDDQPQSAPPLPAPKAVALNAPTTSASENPDSGQTGEASGRASSRLLVDDVRALHSSMLLQKASFSLFSCPLSLTSVSLQTPPPILCVFIGLLCGL